MKEEIAFRESDLKFLLQIESPGFDMVRANSLDIACEAGDIIYVYVAGRSNSYSWGGMLTACVAQKLWTN